MILPLNHLGSINCNYVMWSIGVLQVKVSGLATTATRKSHFSELGVRDYPKIFEFFVGCSLEILTILGVSPPLLSGGGGHFQP